MTGPLPPELAHMPVCPKRGLPIPYIAEVGPDGVGHFTILDPQRARECLAGRLCAMCGKPMGDLVALIGDPVSVEPGGFYIEPPVHERCGELALSEWCPFMSRERVPRRVVEDDGTIAVLGTFDDLATVGRGVAKRGSVMALYRTYRMAMTPTGDGRLMPVYMSFERPVRVRRYGWDAQGRAAEVAADGAERAAAGPPRRAGPRVQPTRQTRAQRRSG